MSDRQPVNYEPERDPIDFSRHLIGSQGFDVLFEDTMTLVEETAEYLDGPGRSESRILTRAGKLTYATESMRLTTQLMQLASWLLLQRAVNKGEMTAEQARAEKAKVNLNGFSGARPGPGWNGLPSRFHELVERSVALHARIRRLDQAINRNRTIHATVENPVRAQLGRLAAAFAVR